MKCPYCFKSSSIRYNLRKGSRLVNYCMYCKSEIPLQYYESEDTEYTRIATLGYSGHGKTSWAVSLLYVLKAMNAHWDGFFIETLDDNSHDALYNDVSDLEQGKPLAPTPAIFPHPVFFRLNNIPVFSQRFVGLFDTGGRLFENLDLMTKKGRFYTQASAVFFFISLAEDDMLDIWNMKIMKLLDRYINVVYSRYGLKTAKKQSIAFVFTKPSLLQNMKDKFRLTPDIESILQSGTIENFAELNGRFLERIKLNSDKIEEWLRKNDCNSFINHAKSNFKNVAFFITSALGQLPADDKVVKKFSLKDPKCVLDPLLWALSISGNGKIMSIG
ncbi:MAG: hypothetical protein U0W24_21480 [Bacteroidales bacterium]